MTLKICKKCDGQKPKADFRSAGHGVVRNICRKCEKKQKDRTDIPTTPVYFFYRPEEL